MTVYIEYVIIDNFTLTYVIGLLSYRALKVAVSKKRNIISSFLGTACAVFYPFLRLNVYVLLGIKVLLGIVLSIILFYKKSKLPISSAVFFGITFLLGGLFFGIGYAVSGDINKALTSPLVDFPIGLLLFVALIFHVLIKRLLTKFHKNRDARADIYKVEFEALDKSFTAQGFCDTGNRLYDCKTGLPIAVVSFSLCQQILPSDSLIKLIAGKGEECYPHARFIEYRPHGSKPQKLWLLRPQKFLLYLDEDKNINIDIMLGLSVHSFSDTADYGLIFGTSVKVQIS